ncbi:MAG: PEP-CTERM sorting domain-containing protein [Rubrivivax sp.]|nr:MAG: PEP-CTERM sorting domain-containing protein [Rubrivivax sp.]
MVFVPEQRYTVYDSGSGYGYGGGYGDGYGGYGGGYGGPSHEVVIPEHNELIPGYTYTVGGQTFIDEVSGSHASSGDPFGFDFAGGASYTGELTGRLPHATTFQAVVPEPESYALALAGFSVLGLLARRRRAKHQA